MSDLNGKVAVVVGCSADRGTGWAVAKALAKAGAKVVAAARSFDRLQVLASEIGGTAVRCDIAKESDVTEVAATAIRVYGHLDIAVNCSAHGAQGMIAEVKRDVLQAGLDTNYFGNFFFVQKMADAIGSDGSIIIFSTLSTTSPNAPMFPYAASKAAADCLVRYAAIEYGPRNIRVNSILPGPIMSDMAGEFLSQPGCVEEFEKHIPLKRIGVPADFADAVLWLASGAYVTGLNISVCGGMQLARLPYFHELPPMGPVPALFDRRPLS